VWYSFSGVSSGPLPILEKRSVITSSRSRSLRISVIDALSAPRSLSRSTQAMSELSGVASWCAVSFAMPTQTWSCSAARKMLKSA
jgi:hypothetical protein